MISLAHELFMSEHYPVTLKTAGFHTGFLAWGGGGEIYWCINEARKCERRGLGAGRPPPPPPPPLDKLNAYAHQGCI